MVVALRVGIITLIRVSSPGNVRKNQIKTLLEIVKVEYPWTLNHNYFTLMHSLHDASDLQPQPLVINGKLVWNQDSL